MLTRGLWVAAASCAVASALAAPAFARQRGHAAVDGRSAAREVRIGSAPVPPRGATPLAGVAAVRTMRVVVALSPRDPIALHSYALAVDDPASPDYRHYLTPSQFRARFAPLRSTVLEVEADLRRHGLHPGGLTANGLAIHVQASGPAIERAFALDLVRVRLADGRDATYNSLAPAVDGSVAPDIQAVIGLSGLDPMRRLDLRRASSGGGVTAVKRTARRSAHLADAGPQPCLKAQQIAPGQGAYLANQVASAYGFSGVYATGDMGQGVTIGVYELEPDAPSDIAAYQACYDTDTQVSYVKVDGGAGTGVGQGEAALDIEQLIGLAPKAKLIVYQGPNNNSDNPGTGPYDTLAAIVSQDQVQVISNSWGECESLEGATDASAEDTLLQEAATQGQTFVSAAGDSGSEDCWTPPPGGNTDNALAVDDPASQPFAIGVGGTSMTAVGPPPTELVWNDDNPNINYARLGIQQGAGGGGISTLWSMPSYQARAPGALGVINSYSSATPCDTLNGSDCREVPDVSADADPMYGYLDYWNGLGTNTHSESGWQGTGGTSAAAPVWAALFALADASRACHGTRVGFADPALYALAGQSQATYFNDITTGNNDFTPSGNTQQLFPAEPGYDMASGLGSPKAAALVPALCAEAVRITDPGPLYTFYDQATRLALHATLAAGQKGPISFRALRLPAGLHLDQTTGVISGHALQPGVRTVTISAFTSARVYGTIEFTWTVERRPRFAARVRGAGSTLSLVVRAQSGAYEPALSAVIIALPASIAPAESARAVEVLSSSGRPLAHSAHFSGRLLTVRLVQPHSPIQIVFPPRSLRFRAGFRAAASTIVVGMVDRLGGHLTLPRLL